MGANLPASMFYKIIEWRRIHFSLSSATLVPGLATESFLAMSLDSLFSKANANQ